MAAMGSSTAETLQDFFPTLVQAVERLSPALAHRVLRLSPDPRVPLALGPLGALSVRSPLLAPLAALGAAIGLAGGAALARGARGPRPLPSQSVWALAFLYFAGMNLSAIACHCLAPRGSTLARLFAGMDVAFTGCSSACLIWASVTERRGAAPGPAAAWLARNRALAAWLWAPVGAAAVAGNVLFPRARAGLNEAIYLGTTFAAVAALFLNEVLRAPRGGAEAARVRSAAAAAGAAGLLAAPLDFAMRSGSGGWAGAMHATFFACDWAFASMWGYLAAKRARMAKAA